MRVKRRERERREKREKRRGSGDKTDQTRAARPVFWWQDLASMSTGEMRTLTEPDKDVEKREGDTRPDEM
jgi:hypothetical protein